MVYGIFDLCKVKFLNSPISWYHCGLISHSSLWLMRRDFLLIR